MPTKIYDANNAIEANLLKNILEQEGILVQILGEYLQGGIGELPAMGLISVMVDEGDVGKAEKIVGDWERGSYAIGDSE